MTASITTLDRSEPLLAHTYTGPLTGVAKAIIAREVYLTALRAAMREAERGDDAATQTKMANAQARLNEWLDTMKGQA